MNPEEYSKMFEVEDRHWWFSGKRRLVRALLERLRLPAGSSILDVGCGTGGMHLLLRDFGRITGIDASPIALSFAGRRGTGRLARASLPSLPFADGSFDVVTIFDVLYHRNVGDDAAAVRELRRVLRPGGVLVVTDSALRWLAGPHDVAMHGARRYSTGDLRRLLAGAGFSVERASYMNSLLFPVAAPWRLAQRWVGKGNSGHSDVSPAPGWVNGILGAVYRLEAAMLGRFNLPIGTSVVAVARRI